MQSEMEKLYQKETGKSAWGHWGPDDCTDEYHGHLKMYVEGPTIEYSAWLEERASKNSMESDSSTSTNTTNTAIAVDKVREVLTKGSVFSAKYINLLIGRMQQR